MGDIGWESRLLETIESRAAEAPELAAEVARSSSEDASEVARFAARYLERRGLFPFVHDAGAGRLNVLARYDGVSDSSARHLVLCGYSRVVQAGDAARLAGVLWAAALVAQLGVPLAGPLTILVVGGEREGQYGVPWVLDRDLIERPSAALIAGPSDHVHPGIGQFGRCQFEVRLTECEQGDSVIVQAAAAVLALRQIAGLRADVPRDIVDVVERSRRVVTAGNGAGSVSGKQFDHVNVNIGTIHGGSAIDAAPQRCVIGLDCGLPFGIDRGRVLGQASRLLAESGVRADVVERGAGALASLTPTTEPIVRSLLGAVRDAVDPRANGVLHMSAGDARWFREHGVPAVQYGPGDGEAPHKDGAAQAPTHAVDAATVYALTMLRYLRTSG